MHSGGKDIADRVDVDFRQRVTDAELDLAFARLEKADRDRAADLNLYGGSLPTSDASIAAARSPRLDPPPRFADSRRSVSASLRLSVFPHPRMPSASASHDKSRRSTARMYHS